MKVASLSVGGPAGRAAAHAPDRADRVLLLRFFVPDIVGKQHALVTQVEAAVGDDGVGPGLTAAHLLAFAIGVDDSLLGAIGRREARVLAMPATTLAS